MPAVAGRRRRPEDVDGTKGYVILQGAVPPLTRAKVRRAADAAGISVGMYLEWLVAREEVDQQGCPVWLPPKPSNEQLVLPTISDELTDRKTA